MCKKVARVLIVAGVVWFGVLSGPVWADCDNDSVCESGETYENCSSDCYVESAEPIEPTEQPEQPEGIHLGEGKCAFGFNYDFGPVGNPFSDDRFTCDSFFGSLYRSDRSI